MGIREIAAVASIAAAVPAFAAATETATATLTGRDGATMGAVTLTQAPLGILFSADVAGLTPGAHGFHIHETASCTPDFKAAGGHFNPSGNGHGLLHSSGHHAGDLPNIHAAADGAARADYFTADVTFAAGVVNSLFDADGSSIIIHALPDSYGENASAGGRFACGVITPD